MTLHLDHEQVTDNPYMIGMPITDHMNAIASSILIFTGIVMIGIVGVTQNASVFALMKCGDPEEGCEITAPSRGGELERLKPPTAGTTEESTKPSITQKVTPNIGILPISQLYKVKVTFTSVTVHDNHEGALSGDGEYDLAAYVQGRLVKLSDASGPGAGLSDVSNGEIVTFDPGTEVTVNLPKTIPFQFSLLVQK